MNRKVELLAPAGNMEKLKTAFYFGADAVYLGGKALSLRAAAGNFDDAELVSALEYAHSIGKKVYVACNIFAFNRDIPLMRDYFVYLQSIGADGVIISDLGAVSECAKVAKGLEIHISTQANTTNKYSARVWSELGASRIVLAREVSLDDIREIRDYLPSTVQIECFVHGAMCVAYSGRCLLSNVLTGRSGNRGECVQACRWEYSLTEASREGQPLTIGEDGRGTYILNSKDLNMLDHLDALIDAGVDSLKIEGRMKTAYYVATVVNAYRRALDGGCTSELRQELLKTSHRRYTTGFYFGASDTISEENKAVQTHDFTALVLGTVQGGIVVEMRNRFAVGDTLEVLSPDKNFNEQIKVEQILSEAGECMQEAKLVQQRVIIPAKLTLNAGDILRKKNNLQ